VKVICLAISYFSEAPVPNELVQIYANKSDLTLQRRSIRREIVPFVRATVLSIGDIQIVGNNSRRCIIFCDTEEIGKVNISFWDKFSDIGRIARKFATLHLFDIKKVPDTETLYSTTSKSLVVLEPDFLVNATEIAECFDWNGANPLLYLLKNFIGFENTEPSILGWIVNICFDELLRNSNAQFEEIFDDAIRQNSISLLPLRLSEENTVNNLQQDAQSHYNRLQGTVNRLERNSAIIEPTFLSDKYGLQGRLDVMLEYSNDNNRRDIIELKSGSAPHSGIWPNHLIQLISYNLLLDSSFPNRTGSCSLLYSKAEIDEALRNAPNSIQSNQDALMLRNQIVAIEHELANGENESIQQINPTDFGIAPPFIEEDIVDFNSTLSAATALEKKYFYAFVSFIAREQRIAKIGSDIADGNEGFASLWRKGIDEKREAFNILAYLKLSSDNSDFENFNIAFKRTDKKYKVSNFRVGDFAVLYPLESDGRSRPLQHQILKCTIKEIDSEYIRVSLRNKQVNRNYFDQFSHWAVEHDLLDVGFNAMDQSLFDFLKSDPKKKKILLGLTEPEFSHIPPIRAEGLNEEQCERLTSAMSAKDYFLLQGPPGTGKTSKMLKEMVRYLMDNTKEDIVLLAFTNRAVDEICDALIDIPDNSFFVRLGTEENTRHVENLLSKLVQGRDIREIKELIMETRIFVSTVSYFNIHQELLQLKNFSTAIIDEATQLLEPHLVGLLAKVKRFILIGDEKQLPAVVAQKEKDTIVEDEDLISVGIEDLRMSLFERLLKRCQRNGWSDAFGMLSSQGRMHIKVAEFPNHEFYANELTHLRDWQQSGEQKFSHNSNDRIEQMIARTRVLFIPSQRERGTKVHKQEAARVNQILKTIARVYGPDFNNETVGVITPYRAQIGKISSRLPETLRELVTVDTVERFQGSEREIIIMSFAVNHPRQLQNLQALTSDGVVDRKLNVALTRAKKHLILLGRPDILNRRTHFRRLIEFIKQENGYIEIE
jgi:DNA replication ATP-dependent helicase Dna2